jgi:glutamine amidotransferase
MKELVIIDYGMGNLRSVQKAFERIEINAIISNDSRIIEKSTKLVLPGVGHFANAVQKIKELGIWDLLNKKALIDKTPILGICLGMQLMTRFSEEGNIEGFGWINGIVNRFKINNKLRYKVPHIGWNTVVVKKEDPLFQGILKKDSFYFVHSYCCACNNPEDELSTTVYESEFASSFSKGNILGVQFHPEKSQEQGDKILSNFAKI